MRVLVTGHRGYIGPHLISLLKEQRIFVTGCDLNLFEDSCIDSFILPDKEIIDDFRNLSARDLSGHDAIIHLAAISNDPMGDLDPALTEAINRDGSVALAEMAKSAGVKRFLFSGSCSIYGKGDDSFKTEFAAVDPVSVYARSKIEAEDAIGKLAGESFTPACLRNATAYGYAPFFRIDLVVNNLLATGFAKGTIEIKSDGEPWRPLIHCRDIARAFVAFLLAEKAKIHNRAVNVGNNTSNYQVKEVALKVKEALGNGKIIFTGETGADPRNYRVSFDLFKHLFPDFIFEYTLERGITEMLFHLKRIDFSTADLESDRFVRLKLLRKSLSRLSWSSLP